MFDLFARIAARPGDDIAGWRHAQAVSVEALRARCEAWRALAMRTPGSQVALYLEDSIEFGAALLGAWLAGKTVWLTADTLEASCTALGHSVDAFYGAFPDRWAPRTPGADERCALAWDAPAPGFAALVVHTSGSSGAPQAIPKRLAQLSSEVATLEQLFGAALGHADVLATVSHQHIYGLLFKVLWPLAAGRALHAHSLDYPEQLSHLLAQRPCVLVASPAHLKRLPAHLDWQGARAMLRAVFSSGGPLTPEAGAEAGRLLGHVPTEIYGSSETGGIAWRRRGPSSFGAWQPLPGVAWRTGADQQLEVCSAHLDTDGWQVLADRVEAAGEHGFMLLGRADRVVKIEEKRVSLDALEAALLACSLVQEARVVLCPEQAGQRQSLAGFAVLSEQGRAVLAAEGKPGMNRRLRQALAGMVEAVALPRRWRYPEQMPLNAQGKTTQAALLALLRDGQPRYPEMVLAGQDDQRILYALTAPAALYYFDGHFPGSPILPGVVQLDWAIHFGRLHFALPPSFCGVNALKFQSVIVPDTPLYLELLHDPAKGSLQFRYFSDAGPHSGGRILFGP